MIFRSIFALTLLILMTNCGTYHAITFTNSTENPIDNELKELSISVEKIVNAGGNHNRKKAIVKRLEAFGLKEKIRFERIDWLSVQKNIIVDFRGKSDSIIYVVAHYDKTDINPLKLASVFLNGLLDPLISWSYASQGAIDNATGVAVALQLAKTLGRQNTHFSYRILFPGSEESGIRGSRAHVARLTPEAFEKIKLAINVDVVGVKDKQNCVFNLDSNLLQQKTIQIAEKQNISLGLGVKPFGASSDYLPFKKTSFGLDFIRSLAFNLTGSFLPQRSYFTKKKATKVIHFSSCEFLDFGDTVASYTLLPIGSIHGFRDNIKKVDPYLLKDMYQIIELFIQENEKNSYVKPNWN